MKRSFSCSADHDVTNEISHINIYEYVNIGFFVVKIVPGDLTIVSVVVKQKHNRIMRWSSIHLTIFALKFRRIIEII